MQSFVTKSVELRYLSSCHIKVSIVFSNIVVQYNESTCRYSCHGCQRMMWDPNASRYECHNVVMQKCTCTTTFRFQRRVNWSKSAVYLQYALPPAWKIENEIFLTLKYLILNIWDYFRWKKKVNNNYKTTSKGNIGSGSVIKIL